MKRIVYITNFLLFVIFAKAQDPHFTQFYAAPMYLNPAYTGFTQQHRFTANYRNQWPGINKTYQTYMAAYDYNLADVNSGIGFYVLQDKAGTSGLKHTQAALNYSYHFKVARKSEIRAGLNIEYNIKSLDYTKLMFNDQLVTGSSVSLDNNYTRTQYMDLGAGALYNSPSVWFGVVAKHLNQPNTSLVGNTEPLPAYIGLHGGYRNILEAKGSSKQLIRKYFAASFNYKHELKYDQLDIGAYYFHSPLNIGLWYRGIPFKHYKPGYPNSESIAILVGLEVPDKNFRIGYSYDLTVSRLRINNTQGAHEVALVYEMAAKKRKRNKNVLITCPKF